MTYLEQPIKDTINYLKMYDGEPTEFDMSINIITARIPKAMYKDYGQCWLGKINLYTEDEKPFKLIQYRVPCPKEASLYNFSFDFCIPKHDPTLEQMINDRANEPYPYSGTKDWEKLQAIFNRIKELNGIHLTWV